MNVENKPLISVIIPVYGNEQYIERCLGSIVSQTYNNLEIIAVNGCSPDNVGAICDKYAERDNRIRVIHKQNEGVNSDRKAGLALSQGEYIAFLDGDDWVDQRMYEVLFEYAEKNNADLVCSGVFLERVNVTKVLHDGMEEGIYDNKEYLSDHLVYFDEKTLGIWPGLNHKLFRREVIYDNYMKLDDIAINGEDMALTIASVLDSNRVYITHEAFYHYRIHDASQTQKKDPIYFIRFNTMLEYVRRKLENTWHTKNLEKQLDRYTIQFILDGLTSKHKYYSDVTTVSALFPSEIIDKKSRIALYGAGVYGENLYKQFSKKNGFNVVLWVDKAASKYKDKYQGEVQNVEELNNTEFDILIIGVKDKTLAEEIRANLVDMGVSENKIIWKKLISIRDFFYTE